MGPIQTLAELLGMLRRRAWVIVAIALVGISAAILHAKAQPRVYESAAVIQIETPLLDDDLARTAAGGSFARRLQLIEQRLMVRDNLAAMIERFDLYGDLPLSLNEKVTLLRQSTRIQRVESAPQGFVSDGSLSALIIAVQMGTPELAARIANELAAGVLDQGAQSRSERVSETLLFFEREEARLLSEIGALEARIARFKRDNDDAMPASLDSRRDELNRLRDNAFDMDQRLLELERDRRALVTAGDRAVNQRQLATVQEELSLLGEQRALLQERAEQLEAAIRRTPEVERELAAYERSLEQLQDQFRVTGQRRAEAEIGQRLNLDQRAERFELLERALPPEHPSGPGRRLLVAAGTVGSIGLGLVVAFLMDLLRPVVRSAAQMHREVGLMPVVALPQVYSAQDRRRQRLLTMAGLALVGLWVLGMAAVALG